MKYAILYVLLLLSGLSKAQQNDSLSKYSIQKLIEKNYITSINTKIYCEELLKRNPSDSTKALVYFDFADYYATILGDFHTTIQLYKKSLVFGKKSNYKEYIILALSRLSIYSIIVNKNDIALKHLAELKKYQNEKGFILNSRVATIYSLIGDFKKSIQYHKKTIQYHQINIKQKGISKKDYDYNIEEIENLTINIANSYNYQGKLDSASFYLDKVFTKDNPNKDIFWYSKTFNLILRSEYDTALAYMDTIYEEFIKNSKVGNYQYLYYKAVCYQQKKDYTKGLKFAKEAIAKKTHMLSFQNFELECYKVAADCAEKSGKIDDAQLYSKKYIKISQQVNYAHKADLMAKLYEQNDIQPLKKELAKRPSNNKILFWGLGLAIIFSIYIIFSISRSKNKKKKFLEIIENLKQKSSTNPEAQEIVSEAIFLEDFAVDDIQHAASNIPVGSGINEETEKKILKLLALFEKKKQFLSPSITTGSLAADMGTNVSYLSNIIKTHKKNNFNGYINQLRIDYIIQKINDDPVYLNYTIEYLAEAAGYTSRTTFIRIFKEIKGIPPSKFIEYMMNYN